jgi:hypothetical protein
MTARWKASMVGDGVVDDRLDDSVLDGDEEESACETEDSDDENGD